MNDFKLNSSFKPSGDQPEAIAQLAAGFREGKKYQTSYRYYKRK